MGRDIGRGVRLALVVAQAGDLGPDERAVGDVVVAQSGGAGSPANSAYWSRKPLGQLGAAEPFQVHGEEGGVVEAVDVAQPVVELQAVQHARAVVEAEDVVGEQVAVAVDDPFGPVPQQWRTAVDERQDERLDGAELVGVDHLIRIRLELGEVGDPPAPQRRGATVDDDVGVPPGAGVEGRQRVGDRAQRRLDVVAVHDQGRQPPRGRHPPHDDQRLGVGPVRRVGREHPADAEVNVGSQAPVERHLPLAGRRPAGRRGEVQEVRAHRLLHLVGAVADEEHHTGVRLVRFGGCLRKVIGHGTDDPRGPGCAAGSIVTLSSGRSA